MKAFTISFGKNWKKHFRHGIALKSRELQLVGTKSFEMKPVEVVGKGLTLGDSSGKSRTIFMDLTSPAHAVDCTMQSAFIGKNAKGEPTFARANNPASKAVLVLIKTAVQHRAPRIVDNEIHTYGGAVQSFAGKPWFVATGHTSTTDYVGRRPVEGRNYDALVVMNVGDAVEIWPEGQNGSYVLANTAIAGLQLFTREQFAEWNAPKAAPAPVAAPVAAENAAQSA